MTRLKSTRLKHLVLAGALTPTLALVPLVPVVAQAPDQGDHPRREGAPRGERAGAPEHRAGGGEHEDRGGRRAQSGEERQGQPNRAERGEGGRNHRQAEDNGNGKTGAAPNRAERGEGGGRNHRQAEENSNGNAGAAPNRAERAQNREERNGKGERAQNREERGGRENAREQRQDRNDKTPKNDNAQRNDTSPRSGNAQRNDETGAPRRLGNDERQGRPDRDRAQNRDERGGPRDREIGRDERGPDRNDPNRNDNAQRRDEPGRRFGNDERRDDRRGGPDNGGPRVRVEVGGGGFGGGFLAPTGARRLDDIRRDRREVREGNRVFIREPGRTIVQEGGRAFIVHDETARYRALGLDVRRERRGNAFVDTVVRPGGETILTFTDADGRLLRRVRRGRDGREIVIIDNSVGGRVRGYEEDVVQLAPPPLRIPRDRYIVDYRGANAGVLYDTLIAPPLAPPPQRYTLDQVRYSPDVRNYVRSIDINTINFDTGSWEVPGAATGQLEALGNAIRKAVDRNPNSVFLIEGYTDATGNPDDNLSLSDRRAQSVAEILTKDFQVPPENLTTQGYGQQNPKEPTQGPSAANRRVVVRNITQLIASGGEPPPGQ